MSSRNIFTSMNVHLNSLSKVTKDDDSFVKINIKERSVKKSDPTLKQKLKNANPDLQTNDDKKKLEILSLGAGVQSSALLLMSLYGVLPKLDYVIFADTGWEPTAVYSHLKKLEKECEKYKVPLIKVKYKEDEIDPSGNIVNEGSNIAIDPFRTDKPSRTTDMPMFVKKEDGKAGMIQRRCTGTYKVKPINKMLAVIMRETGINMVNQWIGISYDELHRMKKHSDLKINNKYPLVDLKIDRSQCREWLTEHNWTATKSSCIGCPYHSNATWQWLKEKHPDDFNRAVQFDHDIRIQTKKDKALDGTVYLHRKLEPLDEIDFNKNKKNRKSTQTDDDFKYGFGNECEGLCGV